MGFLSPGIKQTVRNNVVSVVIRAVNKSRGPGISPGHYECDPRLLLLENRRELEPKDTPRCLIPRLLVVFTRQLEILTTTLPYYARIHRAGCDCTVNCRL